MYMLFTITGEKLAASFIWSATQDKRQTELAITEPFAKSNVIKLNFSHVKMVMLMPVKMPAPRHNLNIYLFYWHFFLTIPNQHFTES